MVFIYTTRPKPLWTHTTEWLPLPPPPNPPPLFTSEPGGARPMMSMNSPSMGTSACRSSARLRRWKRGRGVSGQIHVPCTQLYNRKHGSRSTCNSSIVELCTLPALCIIMIRFSLSELSVVKYFISLQKGLSDDMICKTY